jgi:tetratricopeptide (TPR) repeat protein
VPGVACVALICAGWLAGRGPLAGGERAPATTGAGTFAGAGDGAGEGLPAAGTRAERHFSLSSKSLREIGPERLAVAAAVIVGVLLAAWSQWQPQRSEDAREQALEQVGRDPRGAIASAKLAVSRDPLSPLALFTLADVEQAGGEPAQAHATLQRAVREQPSNPQTWLALARYDLAREPLAALHELQAAIYLDPESIAPELLTPERKDREAIEIYNDYVQALRASAAVPATTGGAAPAGGGH